MLRGGQNLFLELINDILYMVSLRDGGDPTTARLDYINSKVEDVTGYSPKEFIENPHLWINMVHPEDRGHVVAIAHELIKEKEAKARIYRIKTKEGNFIWVEDRLIPVIEGDRVIGFVGVARDVTKRKVLEDILYMALEGDIKKLFDRSVAWIKEALKADLAVIYEVPEGGKEGILRAGEGIKKSIIGKYRLPLQEGTEFHYTYFSQKPVVIEDVTKEDRFSFSPDTYLLSLKSGICLPIRGKEKPYGTLCIYHRDSRHYTEEELDFVTTIANILGVSIERWRFETDLEESEKRLQKVNRLYKTLSSIGEIVLHERNRERLLKKICDISHKEGGFSACWLGLLEDSGLKVIASSGKAKEFLNSALKTINRNLKGRSVPCGKAVSTGEIIICNDCSRIGSKALREEMMRFGFHSSATVPIKSEGEVIGVFNVYSEEKDFFDEETEKLVKEIGDEVSYALGFIAKEHQVGILSTAIEQSSDWVLITDKDGVIQYANNAVEKVSGFSKKELIGKKPNVFKSGRHSKEFYKVLWETLLEGKPYRTVFINRRKNGELFYLDESITPIKSEKGEVIGFVATGKDITQEKEMRERINYLAYYDPVTELPNRSNFMERLRFSIARSKALGRLLAVLLIDVDRFKLINDTYGYQVGDSILRDLGNRIKNSVREGDTVARLGSDEFGVILLEVAMKEDIPKVVGKIFSALEKPFKAGEDELRLTLSVGIAVFPDDGSDPEDLTKKAEIALTHSKEIHSNSYQFFKEEMNARVAEFILMEKHLLRALEKNEYMLFYQPYFNLKDMRFFGMEALIRWNSEDMGIVPPSRFIPILEQTGLIIQVGEWVLEEACRKIALWEIPISVNISPIQFRDEEFTEKVERSIKKAGIEGGYLILEITEGAVMEDVEFATLSLKKLRKLGVRVAVDDFGTGYSSLAYLKKLPVDFLKIDVSFVRDIQVDPDDRAIVNAIIQLAKNLGLKTIAEGIENQKQLDILRDMGCDMGQGFHLAKPMRESEIRDIIRI